jgi:glycosyltransferase involved in cell wall biosynthesis
MGSDVNLQNAFLDRLVKNVIYRNSDVIFASSWSLKDRIEREHHRAVIVVPSSADPSFFRPLNSRAMLRQKWHIEPSKRVVLTVCRLDKNKGVDVLMKSVKLLNSEDVDLVIVGDGEERRSLEELSTSLGMQKNVAFLGFRDRGELLELYNLANVFALASYSEGLPRVLIEAMACGCVPVVTNVGSTAKVVVDGFNGFVVKPGDYREFAERVKKVLSLPEEKLRVMRSRARRAVEKDFDSGKFIEKIVDNINALTLS